LAVFALVGMTHAMQSNSRKENKDFFTDDPRAGTSAAPVWHGPVGGFSKPTKKFEIPKNTEAEPALSRTLDPHDYKSGSGLTYHDKNPEKTAKEYENKYPDVPAGWNPPDETAGTTNTMKTNANDGPSSFKSFAQKFGLHPNVPVADETLL